MPVRRRRLWQLAAVAVLAVGAAALLILISQRSADRDQAPPEAAATSATDSLEGVAQRGTMLGDPRAALVLTEFVDLQCPFCRDAALEVLPEIVDRYVKTGHLRLELRTLRFIGEDSVRGAKAAQAAATRDRMWDFVDAWFQNQGQEGSGYGTDEFIAQVARTAGVPPALVLDGIKAPALEVPILTAEREAAAAGVESTPTFLLGSRPGRGQRLDLPELTVESLSSAIDQRLGQ